jgi:hypothetical protein
MFVSVFAFSLGITAGTIRPYYQRRMPVPQRETDFASDTYHIDFSNAHMAPYGVLDPVTEANRLFDKRAAAAIRASVGIGIGVNIWPQGQRGFYRQVCAIRRLRQ